MELLIGVLVGALAFYTIQCLCKKKTKPSGTFIVNMSDPEDETCKLEFDENLNDICTKKQFVLNVKVIK